MAGIDRPVGTDTLPQDYVHGDEPLKTGHTGKWDVTPTELPQKTIGIESRPEDNPTPRESRRSLHDTQTKVVTTDKTHVVSPNSDSHSESTDSQIETEAARLKLAGHGLLPATPPPEGTLGLTVSGENSTEELSDTSTERSLTESDSSEKVTLRHKARDDIEPSVLESRKSVWKRISVDADDLSMISIDSHSSTLSVSEEPVAAYYKKPALHLLKASLDSGATFWVKHKIKDCTSHEQLETLAGFIQKRNPAMAEKCLPIIEQKRTALQLGMDVKSTKKLLTAIDAGDYKFIQKKAEKLTTRESLLHLQLMLREKSPAIFSRLFTPADLSVQLMLRKDIPPVLKRAYSEAMDTTKVTDVVKMSAMMSRYVTEVKKFGESKGPLSAQQRQALYNGLVGLGTRFIVLHLYPASAETGVPTKAKLAQVAYDTAQVRSTLASPKPGMPKGQTDIFLQAGIWLPKDKIFLYEKCLGLKLTSKDAVQNDLKQAEDARKNLKKELAKCKDEDQQESLKGRITSLDRDIAAKQAELKALDEAVAQGIKGQDQLFEDCYVSLASNQMDLLRQQHLACYALAVTEDEMQTLQSPKAIASTCTEEFSARAVSIVGKERTKRDDVGDGDTEKRRLQKVADKEKEITDGVEAVLKDMMN
ncbi:hypothetical protein ACWJJH_06685 [Endozoicomonadaceae bacterium StTr2]